MEKYFKSNRECWNRLVKSHVASEFYDLDGFLKGKCTLPDFEVDEIGDVSGKSLLHLMCHFGMDTLSWARRGARVTGVDFSSEGISKAKSLAAELGMEADFIECNVYDLMDHLTGEFDIVYTSAGVLAWLSDLEKWAEIIARFVKPGGKFYIREFHPVASMFDDELEPSDPPKLRYPYFNPGEPSRFENVGSYAEPDGDFCTVNYEWFHPLSDILNSLIEAGLVIEAFREYPYSTYKSHPFLVRGEDGYYRCDVISGGLPLMFSILARNDRK